MCNIGMVEKLNLLLAIWDGTSGGTGNCVRAAKTRGVDIQRIHPDAFKS